MLVSTRETGKRRTSFRSALHCKLKELTWKSDVIAFDGLAMRLIVAVSDGGVLQKEGLW
jgi:hypothetical protein